MNGWGITLCSKQTFLYLKIIRICQISQVKSLNIIYQKEIDYDQLE